MEYFESIILPLLVSTGASILLIPYIIRERTIKKRKIVIALTLGEIIKEINSIFEEIDCLDKSRQTSIFLNNRNMPNFISSILPFNNKLYKVKNDLLFIEANMSYSYSELIKKYDKEIVKLSYLRAELINTSIRFSDLLPNKIIEQISKVCFEISGLNYENRQLKKVLNSFEGCGPDIMREIDSHKIPANYLTKLYNELFNLQDSLVSLNYFKNNL